MSAFYPIATTCSILAPMCYVPRARPQSISFEGMTGMSDQIADTNNGKPHKAKITCALTGKEYPRSAVVSLATVLPSLVERIRKDIPNSKTTLSFRARSLIAIADYTSPNYCARKAAI